MAWIFYQTGILVAPDGVRTPAYSGKGIHKNDPDSQNLPMQGPLPCGIYHIGSPFDSPEHGPYVLRLTPDAANEMFGRAGFLIHGDSKEHPGEASNGCIVAPRATREQVYLSGDKELHVVAREQTAVAVDPGMETE